MLSDGSKATATVPVVGPPGDDATTPAPPHHRRPPPRWAGGPAEDRRPARQIRDEGRRGRLGSRIDLCAARGRQELPLRDHQRRRTATHQRRYVHLHGSTVESDAVVLDFVFEVTDKRILEETYNYAKTYVDDGTSIRWSPRRKEAFMEAYNAAGDGIGRRRGNPGADRCGLERPAERHPLPGLPGGRRERAGRAV